MTQEIVPDPKAPTSHRADTLIGAGVTAFGAFVLIGALVMPRMEQRNIDPLTAPGVTPGLIGAIILVLGVVLTLRGMRKTGRHAALSITQWSGPSVRRTLFTLAALIVYGFGLFGKVPFVPGTAAFIFCFTVGAELMRPERTTPVWRIMIGAAVLAVVSSVVIWVVFTRIFLVQLPG
jgi:putative tricarboxylic transport membrane protein